MWTCQSEWIAHSIGSKTFGATLQQQSQFNSHTHTFILSQIDCCNSVLLGLSDIRLNCYSQYRYWVHMVVGFQLLLEQRKATLVSTSRTNLQAMSVHPPNLERSLLPNYVSLLVSRTTSNDQHSKLHSGSSVQVLIPPPAKTAKISNRLTASGNLILWHFVAYECYETLLCYSGRI